MTKEEKAKSQKENEINSESTDKSSPNYEQKDSELKTKDKSEQSETKINEKKPVVKEVPKRTEAIVRGENLPISTKHSMAVGKFIKGKKIQAAISDLEGVVRLKRAVPMKGEIPHRHGKGMMSGRFPKKTAEHFIKLLKSLAANAEHFKIENPVIVEVVPNIGHRPFGRFGAHRKKRTHIVIRARELLKVGGKK